VSAIPVAGSRQSSKAINRAGKQDIFEEVFMNPIAETFKQ
jgi:hypothetical protein